jgi:hypothetical protein
MTHAHKYTHSHHDFAVQKKKEATMQIGSEGVETKSAELRECRETHTHTNRLRSHGVVSSQQSPRINRDGRCGQLEKKRSYQNEIELKHRCGFEYALEWGCLDVVRGHVHSHTVSFFCVVFFHSS